MADWLGCSEARNLGGSEAWKLGWPCTLVDSLGNRDTLKFQLLKSSAKIRELPRLLRPARFQVQASLLAYESINQSINQLNPRPPGGKYGKGNNGTREQGSREHCVAFY